MREIETQAVAAQQQIGLARSQMTGKQREQRLVRLTLSELSGLADETVVYEGIGKMCVVWRHYPSSLLRPVCLRVLVCKAFVLTMHVLQVCLTSHFCPT